MTLVLKHKKLRGSKKVLIHFGGSVTQVSGYVNATKLNERQQKHLVDKMNYQIIEEKDYGTIPQRVIRILRIPIPAKIVEEKTVSYKVKACRTEGCTNQIRFGIKSGDHLRQYCDVCKAIRDEKAA